MSLDFPASPTEGQTYAAEGALYRYTNGRWAIMSQNEALTAIFGGDVTSGWVVFGDTLMCWGGDALHNAPVTFPRTFATLPRITLGVIAGVSRFSTISAPTVNGFTMMNWSDSGSSAGAPADWIAVGEALDADKTPKILAGANAAQVIAPQMMHGNIAAGWWVTGDKLECWGSDIVPGTGRLTMPFPRAFKTSPPTLIGNRASGSSFSGVTVGAYDATTLDLYLWSAAGNPADGTVKWYAVGEATDADKRPQ